MADRPTQALIFTRLREAQTYFAPLRQEMGIDNDYWQASSAKWANRMAAHVNRFPKGYILMVPGIVQFAVNVGVNQIYIGDRPSVTVTLPSDTHTDPKLMKEHKERLEAGFMGLLWAIETYYGRPIREMVQTCNALGLGAISYPLDKVHYPPDPYPGRDMEALTPAQRRRKRKWQLQRKRRLPWDFQAIHPMTLYFDSWHTQPEWFIEEKVMAPAALASRYPNMEIAFSNESQTQSVTVVTYCDADWYAVYANNAPLLTKADGVDEEGVAPNRLGTMWTEMAIAPFGVADERNNPQYRIAGIIRANRATFDKFISDFNLAEIAKLLRGLPTVGFRGQGPNGEELAKTAMATFELGKPWAHSSQVEQHSLDLPEIPESIWKDEDMALALLEMGIGPEVLRGEFRDEPAIGQEARRAQAKVMYYPLQAETQHALAAMLMNLAWQIKYELDEDLEFPTEYQGKTTLTRIQRDDILDEMQVDVDLSPPTPQERAMQFSLDKQMVDDGWIDIRTGRQRHEIYNSDELDQQIFEDKLMNHPIIVDAVAQFLADTIVGVAPELAGEQRAADAQAGLPPPQPIIPQGSTPLGIIPQGSAPLGPELEPGTEQAFTPPGRLPAVAGV